MEEQVVLVNERDEPVGLVGKLQAHQDGLLHRAFSIFIFNPEGQLLLQRRAMEKYHSAGLWTNTCCSHPRNEEPVAQAAARRLQEEMGFSAPLTRIFDFIYKADCGNGLQEHEFDHVFAGEYIGIVPFNPAEVMDSRFMNMIAIQQWLEREPEAFTVWFRLAFPRIQDWWASKYASIAA